MRCILFYKSPQIPSQTSFHNIYECKAPKNIEGNAFGGDLKDKKVYSSSFHYQDEKVNICLPWKN
jgi:hypothetical protein